MTRDVIDSERAEESWLGELPDSWRTVPLWTLFERVKRTGFAGEELLSVYRDHGVVIKASRDDNNNNASEDLSTYQLVEPGDLAINKMKAWQGSAAISAHRGIVSPAYFIFRSRHQENSQFLHYLMRSSPYIAMYGRVSKGVRPGQWDLDPQQHSRIPIPLPPSHEQCQIADYLDAQTAKIDALIGKQERLIETLAERRQAVISHAVTKGLDPTAPMKETGSKWFGAVPCSWEISPFRWLLTYLTSGSRGWAEYYADAGAPFVRIGNLTRGSLHIDMADTQYVQIPDGAEGSRAVIEAGDVLFSITAYLGSVAVAGMRDVGSFVSQHVALARIDTRRTLPRFLGYVVLSEAGQRQLNEQAYGGTKIQLSLEDIKNLEVTVPTIAEQHDIVTYLDRETSQIDALSAKARQMIDILKERRQALISAAVTGKIDVRGLA